MLFRESLQLTKAKFGPERDATLMSLNSLAWAYLAVAAIFVGVSTLYAPWGVRDLLGAGLVAILIHVFVVRREEPATRRRLGSVYDAYYTRVPRWLPRFSTRK